MISVRRALLGRELGRLASGRTMLFGGIIALTILSLGAASVVFLVIGEGPDPVERAAQLRHSAYSVTESFTFILFLIAAVLGANQVGSDARSGTLFGILARPVSRAHVFLAGWAASALFLLGMEALRALPFLGASAWVEGRLGLAPVVGALAILAGHWLALAEFAALGAVMPPAYAAIGGFAIVVTGGLASSQEIGGFGARLIGVIGWLVPRPGGQESVIATAIQGGARGVSAVAEVVAYRACWTLLFLGLGVLGFARRDLAPRS